MKTPSDKRCLYLNQQYGVSNTYVTTFLLQFVESSIDFSPSLRTAAANPTSSFFGFPYLLRANHLPPQSSEDTDDILDLSFSATQQFKTQPNQP